MYDKLLNRFWQQTRHCKEVGGAGAYVLVRHISIVGLPNNFYASAYWHKCTRMVPCSAYSTQRRFFHEIVWSINIKYGSCAILIGIFYFSKTLFELTCKLVIICFTHRLWIRDDWIPNSLRSKFKSQSNINTYLGCGYKGLVFL